MFRPTIHVCESKKFANPVAESGTVIGAAFRLCIPQRTTGRRTPGARWQQTGRHSDAHCMLPPVSSFVEIGEQVERASREHRAEGTGTPESPVRIGLALDAGEEA